MNTISLDYGKSLKDLITQTFSFKRYKEFGLFPSILFVILLSPLFIVAGVLSLFYLGVYTFFKIVASPVDYLTAVIRNEGSEVKHATQFIIYFIGFPTVFLLNVILSFFSVFLFIIFLLLSIICQIISLGGTTWAPFLNNQVERIEKEDLKNPKLNCYVKLIYLFVCVVVGIVLEIINSVEPFFISVAMFAIAYALGLILMPIELKINKDHKNKISKVNEESVEVKEEDNTGISNLIFYITLGILTVLSIGSLIAFILVRNFYLFKSTAFTITLVFTIVSFVALIAFTIVFCIKIGVFKKGFKVVFKSLNFILGIVGITFSTAVGITGAVCSSLDFYPELAEKDTKYYYGTYEANTGSYHYKISIYDSISIRISNNNTLKTGAASYYFGPRSYAYAVAGVNKACLIVDTSKLDLYDSTNGKNLFYIAKNVIFKINSDSIVVSPGDWNMTFLKN